MGQKIIRLLLIIVLGILVMPGMTVFAADPFASISMQSIHGYQSLVGAGDMAIVFHWKWSDNTSSYPASSAVSISISYNGTIVAQTAPYVFSPFATNGYGDEMTGFYFSANSSPVYGGNYTITIVGLPDAKYGFSSYVPYPTFNYTLPPGDYDTSSDQTANQADLKTYILNECDIFKTIYPTVDLKSTTDTGTHLSDVGSAYFTAVIPGLNTLCPALFFVQTYIPTAMPVQPYSNAMPDARATTFRGTDLYRGADRAGTYIGVNGFFVWGVIAFAICIYVIVQTSKRDWPLESALFIDFCLLTLMAYAMGNLIFTIVMVAAFLALIGIAYVIYGRRAA